MNDKLSHLSLSLWNFIKLPDIYCGILIWWSNMIAVLVVLLCFVTRNVVHAHIFNSVYYQSKYSFIAIYMYTCPQKMTDIDQLSGKCLFSIKYYFSLDLLIFATLQRKSLVCRDTFESISWEEPTISITSLGTEMTELRCISLDFIYKCNEGVRLKTGGHPVSRRTPYISCNCNLAWCSCWCPTTCLWL